MYKSNRYLGGMSVRVFSALTLFFIMAAMALAQGEANQPAPDKPSADAPGSTADTKEILTASQIHVQSNLVTAPVTVIDKLTGEFVYNLEEKDFQIYDNGKLQEITGFSRESHEISVV